MIEDDIPVPWTVGAKRLPDGYFSARHSEKPMALTLDISADMELLLHKQAAMNGQEVTAYLLKLVEKDIGADLSEYAGLEDFAGSVAGIQAGLDDVEAGRTYSMEEVFGELNARAQERRAAREGERTQ